MIKGSIGPQAAWILGLLLSLWQQYAHADLWAFVDERGVAHFAAEPLDDRFVLFFRGDLPGVLKAAPVPAEPRPEPQRPRETVATGVPVTAGSLPQPVDGGGSPAASAAGAWAQGGARGAALWVRTYLERLPAYAQVRQQLHEAALTHGVEPELLQALIATESGFDARAVSPKGAIGLMQVMPDTAVRFGLGGDNRATVEKKLLDPAINLTTGLRYVRFLMNLFAGRLDLVLAAYNAGEGAVQRAGHAIPNYPETLNYVRTVMQLYTLLKPAAPRDVVPTSVAEGAVPFPPPAPPAPRADLPGGARNRGNMVAPLTHLPALPAAVSLPAMSLESRALP